MTNSSDGVTCYHVTPSRNMQSIDQYGLNPAWARTKRRALWIVERDVLQWAVAHTANRHNVRISDLTVYVFTVQRENLIRTRWKGVYQVVHIIPAKVAGIIDNSEITSILEKPEHENV